MRRVLSYFERVWGSWHGISLWGWLYFYVFLWGLFSVCIDYLRKAPVILHNDLQCESHLALHSCHLPCADSLHVWKRYPALGHSTFWLQKYADVCAYDLLTLRGVRFGLLTRRRGLHDFTNSNRTVIRGLATSQSLVRALPNVYRFRNRAGGGGGWSPWAAWACIAVKRCARVQSVGFLTIHV